MVIFLFVWIKTFKTLVSLAVLLRIIIDRSLDRMFCQNRAVDLYSRQSSVITSLSSTLMVICIISPQTGLP